MSYFFASDTQLYANDFVEVTYHDLKQLHVQNFKDSQEIVKLRDANLLGTYHQPKNLNTRQQLALGMLCDSLTDGYTMEYPHGVVITQGERNHYYRGENQIYTASIPTVTRKTQVLDTPEAKAIYQLVADMRIYMFGDFIWEFDHVKKWVEYGDVLTEVLAQHYGFETNWLDITNDFNIALFFATCFYDNDKKCWQPLTKAQTEQSEDKKYGVLFHSPKRRVEENRNIASTNIYQDQQYRVNAIWPIGFQPFMRCHMQSGYGIQMQEPYPLQQDCSFEKIYFRHDEAFSRFVFENMGRGKKIYPHEGLQQVNDLIEQLKVTTTFSQAAFEYACEKNPYFKTQADALEKLANHPEYMSVTITQNATPINLTRQRKRQLNRTYADFSLKKTYGIHQTMRMIYRG